MTTDVHAERPTLTLGSKLLNLTQDQLDRLCFGYIGRLSMIAAYFMLTQWLRCQHVQTTLVGLHLDVHLWHVKYRWDHLLRQCGRGSSMPPPRSHAERSIALGDTLLSSMSR
jgi:hypothetical protein